MQSLTSALVAYGITIVFAMVIAVIIQLLGRGIKLLKLDADEAPVDTAVPSANSLKEDEAIAVAIAVARAKQS
ncbi:MAG TPA: hypothetical protein VL527_14105 [Dongiaceae bacterium]|jgi:hypothetical protein|nr:hypothetical protein [Dongiaceae bacterium]